MMYPSMRKPTSTPSLAAPPLVQRLPNTSTAANPANGKQILDLSKLSVEQRQELATNASLSSSISHHNDNFVPQGSVSQKVPANGKQVLDLSKLSVEQRKRFEFGGGATKASGSLEVKRAHKLRSVKLDSEKTIYSQNYTASAKNYTGLGAQRNATGEGFYFVASTMLGFGDGTTSNILYNIPNMDLPEISIQSIAKEGSDPLIKFITLRILQDYFKNNPQHQPEHLLLMGPDGQNLGYDASGFVSNIQGDRILKVENGGTKYRAKFVDKAAAMIAAEDALEKQKYGDSRKKILDYIFKNGDIPPLKNGDISLPENQLLHDVYASGKRYKTYDLYGKNCQHYVCNVIERAQQLADAAGESLIMK